MRLAQSGGGYEASFMCLPYLCRRVRAAKLIRAPLVVCMVVLTQIRKVAHLWKV